MIENGKKNFVNISISFLRSWSQILYLYIAYCNHYVRKIKKKNYSRLRIIFNMMMILPVLEVTTIKTMIKESRKSE